LFIDLSEIEVFDSAITYTGIFLFSKAIKEYFSHAKLDKNNTNQLQNLSKAKLNQVTYEKIADTVWLLSSQDLQNIFDKINQFPLLSELSNIFVGLQTSADPAYILEIREDGLYSKYAQKTYQFDYDIVKPLLKGAEIKRYSQPIAKYKVIFPYQIKHDSYTLLSEKELKNNYPLIGDYFLECVEKLNNREKGKINIKEWWGYVYPKNLGCFDKKKIITQVLANHSSLTLDINQQYYFVGGGTAGGYGILLKENSKLSYEYLLGVLNSTILEKYLQSYSTPFKGGFFAYNRETMGRLPIPIPSEADKQAITFLVQKCLDAKGVGVLEWEAEIDDRVAHLYGLTDEEMKIIRGD
jgi:hypothetical protein